jgi:hypothetical protein
MLPATRSALSPGRAATELDAHGSSAQFPRNATGEAVDAVAERGVRVSVVRLPQVHNPLKQGLITLLIALAKEKGVSAYVGDGENRWPAVHVLNAAHLYRFALEANAISGTRYRAVAEEGVRLRDIAEAVGRRVDVPVKSIASEEAAEHFGWLASLAAVDLPRTGSYFRYRSRSRGRRALLTLGRLPQLALVSLRVHDPTEYPELRLLNVVEHLAALFTQQLQESVKIRDAIVDHERCVARCKVGAVSD